MATNLTDSQKSQIVAQYIAGQSVALLCAEHGVPRSTLYYWIRKHHPLQSAQNTIVSYHDFYNLKRRVERLETLLEIIKISECSLNAPLKEKLFALEKLYGRYSVHALCDALEVSRGTFYNHIFRKKDITVYDKRRKEIGEQVEAVFNENKQRFGSNKICAILSERGIKTSAKYVAELMREMGLQCIGRNSKREYKKQMSRRGRPNVIKQQFDVSEPNRVWVSDITCFMVNGKYYYICLIIDLFSRKIIAHKVSHKNSTYIVTSTFRKAFESRTPPEGLIFHSDRGGQYTSHTFQKLLHINNIVQSFSASGRPHDNAVAEAVFSSMKKEELYRTNYKSEREFFNSVDSYIQFFNLERPHATLAYRTPERVEAQYQDKKITVVNLDTGFKSDEF